MLSCHAAANAFLSPQRKARRQTCRLESALKQRTTMRAIIRAKSERGRRCPMRSPRRKKANAAIIVADTAKSKRSNASKSGSSVGCPNRRHQLHCRSRQTQPKCGRNSERVGIAPKTGAAKCAVSQKSSYDLSEREVGGRAKPPQVGYDLETC